MGCMDEGYKDNWLENSVRCHIFKQISDKRFHMLSIVAAKTDTDIRAALMAE